MSMLFVYAYIVANFQTARAGFIRDVLPGVGVDDPLKTDTSS
jgi:hypothetical protein